MKAYNKISSSDTKILAQFMAVINKVGYPPSVMRFIKKEISKEMHDDFKAGVCKKCDRVRYKVSLYSYDTKPPTNPRLCVECNPPVGTKTFKPKMSIEDAWGV